MAEKAAPEGASRSDFCRTSGFVALEIFRSVARGEATPESDHEQT
jgi:predicted nucleotidyltransferase